MASVTTTTTSTPTAPRAGGPPAHCSIDTPWGRVLVVGRGGRLAGLFLADHPRSPVPAPDWHQEAEQFGPVREQLGQYFAGSRTSFDLPLDLVGTAFQVRVWRALAEIPYGTTVAYGELAQRIGHSGAARAVGSASGRNPVSIVLPCHRVVGADGSLTGYGGGLWRKRRLLELEAGQGRLPV